VRVCVCGVWRGEQKERKRKIEGEIKVSSNLHNGVRLGLIGLIGGHILVGQESQLLWVISQV